MLEYCIRAVGMYFMAMIMIRLLGKRALGELGPFDFVVMTGVGHTVIAIAMDQSLPVYGGIAVLAVLLILEYAMTFLALKNATLSGIIVGKPKVLIDDGKIIKENMKKEMFNVDDLMQELRKQGIRDIRDVDKGIIEACGGFSVILKNDDQSLSCRDLGIKSVPDVFSTLGGLTRQEVFELNRQEDLNAEQSAFNLVQAFAELNRKIDALEEKLRKLG
jgi:uncharacterized membrane protein YcaP (DUF421 family)